jgi:hypothetical protein
LRLVLADETGEIPVVIWNEKVDEVKGILQKENAMLQVVNAKVKRTLDGKLEIHADRETYIDVFEAEKEFWKIAELKDGMKDIHVRGEVATKPITREVKTAKGESCQIDSFRNERTKPGEYGFLAWRKNAEKTSKPKNRRQNSHKKRLCQEEGSGINSK